MLRLEFELTEDDYDNIVVEGIKKDTFTAYGCGDYSSFDAMYKTLLWYVGHTEAFAHRYLVVSGVPD